MLCRGVVERALDECGKLTCIVGHTREIVADFGGELWLSNVTLAEKPERYLRVERLSDRRSQVRLQRMAETAIFVAICQHGTNETLWFGA